MIITACECNDDIPGVDRLPFHLHRDVARILIDDETHPRNGSVIELPWDSWVLNDDRPTFRLIERVIELRFHIDWKEVVRSEAAEDKLLRMWYRGDYRGDRGLQG